MRKATRRKILKWMVIVLASIFLFIWAKDYALQERGYQAAGGEYMILGIPFLWACFEPIVLDVWDALRKYFKTDGEDDA